MAQTHSKGIPLLSRIINPLQVLMESIISRFMPQMASQLAKVKDIIPPTAETKERIIASEKHQQQQCMK
jgi:hypothetical protein